MDKNPGKSIRDNLTNIFNCLKKQHYVRNVVHLDLENKSYIPPSAVSSERGAHHDSLKYPQDLRVNAGADVYVKTPQIIVVKLPWTDSVADEGRPLNVFQQDSAPSHKALKTQDYMDGREFSSLCHIRLMTS
ncbi:unnamed protein product [Hymenolepis diminuta]|uniref:Uncharacterized protein n=1 Tax=Hymenolepis diminuta TaxID=6216 RepID=A0A564YT25_HYMDI|nr:unnamed protein product [Hymenolepis diminuta]